MEKEINTKKKSTIKEKPIKNAIVTKNDITANSKKNLKNSAGSTAKKTTEKETNPAKITDGKKSDTTFIKEISPSKLASMISGFLEEKKAIDISIIDLGKDNSIADYFVLASARTPTSVRAFTEYIDEKLSKDYGIEPLRRDSAPQWRAVDYGSVIMHILTIEAREFYEIERLYAEGKNLLNPDKKGFTPFL